jgi:isopenicillin N synthase-like dioxygenase
MKIPIINASQLGKRANPELDKAIGDAAYACGFLILTDLPNFKPSKLADHITAIYSLPAGEQDKLQKKNFNAENENQYRGMYHAQLVDDAISRPAGYDIGPDICYPLHPLHDQDILREKTPLPDPHLLPGWQAATANWYRHVQQLGINLLSALARANNYPEDSFAIDEQECISTFRILHYPQFSKDKAATDAIATIAHQGEHYLQTIGTHVDSGLITILYQCNEPGLQALSPADEWVDVPVIKDSLVINFGGLIERMTGGQIKATRHRVISQGRQRFSLPFFFEPEAERMISAMPGVPPFKPFYYGDYLWTKATQFPPNIGLGPLRENRGIFIDPISG